MELERSGYRHWYESVPMAPIVVAKSQTLPEGTCKSQLKRYLEELGNGTLWATQMFDASAKYPYGIVDGQTVHLGSFDQCYRLDAKVFSRRGQEMETKDIHGRYCLVDFKYEQRVTTVDFRGKLNLDFDPNDSIWESIREKGDFRRTKRYLLQMALCVPAACTAEDVEKALQGPYKDFSAKNNLIVKASVDKMNCQARHEEIPFSTGATVYCIVLLIIFALVVAGSMYDGTLRADEKETVVSRGLQLLLCFSARRNLRTVFEVSYKHRGFDTIHILRIYTMTFVIFGHRMMQYYLNTVVNKYHLEKTYVIPSFIVLHNGPIIVDGFFAIGGLLTCYGFLKQFDKTKKMNFFGLTFIRFLRFTPAYALLVFFHVYLFPHMGSGPQWQSKIIAESKNCAATWWANLLYLNNYMTMEKLCIFQSWYLTVDFHCYLLNIVLVFAFWKLPRRIGYLILGAATIMSIMIPFYITYVNRIQPMFIGFPYLTNLSMDPYFVNYYVKPYMRMTAYLVGVIAGTILYDYENTSWRISKKWSQSLFLLLVFVVGISSQSLGFQYLDPNSNTSLLETALYASLHRGAFAISFCSIVLLITMGDGLDYYYKILTPGWVQPFARLTYGMFLTHNIIQSYDIGTIRNARTFGIRNVLWDFVPDVIFSFLIALLIAIGIEGPFRKIEKHFISKRIKGSSKAIISTKDQIKKEDIKMD
ncbi:PREDICTED: nose resistant to fluoxetine protein 6-like [Ceratosolen solmsi marchali]|uniref:Nose resistant to fluoxetine protein 6-like n=1 Tax=Ceratosolen solmsi marchali TaxID=326594 RepID=A0AAJ6VMQ3_9HYME|nr:PREDICTED: nose resistant to fluoxetine protein 6-like [Ceratosolen solmsi marchali]